jgi:hypothetical protein
MSEEEDSTSWETGSTESNSETYDTTDNESTSDAAIDLFTYTNDEEIEKWRKDQEMTSQPIKDGTDKKRLSCPMKETHLRKPSIIADYSKLKKDDNKQEIISNAIVIQWFKDHWEDRHNPMYEQYYYPVPSNIKPFLPNENEEQKTAKSQPIKIDYPTNDEPQN